MSLVSGQKKEKALVRYGMNHSHIFTLHEILVLGPNPNRCQSRAQSQQPTAPFWQLSSLSGTVKHTALLCATRLPPETANGGSLEEREERGGDCDGGGCWGWEGGDYWHWLCQYPIPIYSLDPPPQVQSEFCQLKSWHRSQYTNWGSRGIIQSRVDLI